MLVLTRLQGESICIGDRLITITVLAIRGDKVRIGIEAPDDIPVHRAEIQDRVDKEGTTRDS